MNGVFANSDFVNGYMEFCDSAEFTKYMAPYLGELLENARRSLESADDCKRLQGEISMLRKILQQPAILKREKLQAAKDSSAHSGQE